MRDGENQRIEEGTEAVWKLKRAMRDIKKEMSLSQRDHFVTRSESTKCLSDEALA
jgi:hypothetical protein